MDATKLNAKSAGTDTSTIQAENCIWMGINSVSHDGEIEDTPIGCTRPHHLALKPRKCSGCDDYDPGTPWEDKF